MNNRLATATTAIWKIAYREWVTTLTPILVSFYRMVVSDQCFTPRGSASLRSKFPNCWVSNGKTAPAPSSGRRL